MSIAVFEAVPDDIPHDVPDQVFRRRDVRGRYGDTLTLEVPVTAAMASA